MTTECEAAMLQVQSLSVAIGRRTLLHDLGLDVAAGELLAVIGPNGAGKSSLLHALIGDLEPAHGRVIFAGRPLAAWADRQRARRVALLPQFSRLDFPFPVREVVRLGRGPHASGTRVDRQIVADACVATDIVHLRDRSYTQLSGGEKQRVQLARVMAQIWRHEDAGERLLLLDEPVAALDLGHQQLVLQRVRAFADAGVAVVMVLHDISLAARHADRMLALRGGHAIAQGSPAEVVTAATIRGLFDTEARVIAHPDTGMPVVLHA